MRDRPDRNKLKQRHERLVVMIPEVWGQNSKDTTAFYFCSLGRGQMKSQCLRIRVVEAE